MESATGGSAALLVFSDPDASIEGGLRREVAARKGKPLVIVSDRVYEVKVITGELDCKVQKRLPPVHICRTTKVNE